MIVLLPPILNHDLGLMTVGENPAIQTFSSKLAVETLNKRVLPRAAGLDVHRLALAIPQPLLQSVSNKLRTIIAAQVLRRAAQQKEPFQLLDDLARRNGAGDMNRQTLTGIFVENGQHPQLPPALGTSFQKVVGPDLIGVAGTPKLAGRVRQSVVSPLSGGAIAALPVARCGRPACD